MKIYIIGAGGHSKVIIQTARVAGFEPIGIFDDNEHLHGCEVLGVPVLGMILQSLKNPLPSVLAIGNNIIRKQFADMMKLPWVTLVHPSSIIDQTVKIGEGTVVFAGTAIQADSIIGSHVIVNTSASIDHDCFVDDFVHIAPGCNLCGNVKIGEGALLGVGTCAKPNTKIGSWSIIGAGAAVVSDIPDKVTVVGVPAKTILENNLSDKKNSDTTIMSNWGGGGKTGGLLDKKRTARVYKELMFRKYPILIS